MQKVASCCGNEFLGTVPPWFSSSLMSDSSDTSAFVLDGGTGIADGGP